MTTPFGPQLIGETEKTLNALLLRHLQGTGLTEPQWVTLRVATMLDGAVDHDGLAAAVADRAHFPDAAQHVDDLTKRGLLDDGRLTSEGRELLARLQAAIAGDANAVFDDLAPDDIATTERVLNELLSRARVVLAT
jgi:DNA-binding MarR family transcriptional regulator